MDGLKFNKHTILHSLQKNREEHLTIVREAQKGFREKAISIFEDKLTALKEGKPVSIKIDLNLPQNHTDDFDRAIDMLTKCVDEEVALTEREFQRFVRNNWEWRDQFLYSNSGYSKIASDEAVGAGLL